METVPTAAARPSSAARPLAPSVAEGSGQAQAPTTATLEARVAVRSSALVATARCRRQVVAGVAKTGRPIGVAAPVPTKTLQATTTAPAPAGRPSPVPGTSTQGLLAVLITTAVPLDVVLTAILATPAGVPGVIAATTATGAEGQVPVVPLAPVQVVPPGPQVVMDTEPSSQTATRVETATGPRPSPVASPGAPPAIPVRAIMGVRPLLPAALS